MNTQNTPQINENEYVLYPLKIDAIIFGDIWLEIDKKHSIKADPDLIVPLPRDGEYRLTADDLETFLIDLQEAIDAGEIDSGDDFERTTWIERWLENRKEEA